jgi:putative ABC transport system ATP-binding protein
MSLMASPAASSRAPRTVPVAGTMLLEARALHKKFGQTAALRGIDFRLAAGEIVAVMGPSGSGKSTLLHCLAGIALPDDGEVTFEGRSMAAISDADRSRLRRTEFGFVFQFGQLIPELSAIENIALPLLLNGNRRGDAEQLAAEARVAAYAHREVIVRDGRISGTETS